MKLASHNSISYAPVVQWYFKPFFWVTKCQSKSIEEQYNAGVKYFDIRLDGGIPAHGLIHYKARILDIFEYLNSKGDCTVRILCENLKKEEEFKFSCKVLENHYKDIVFCGGWDRNNRSNIVYKFKNPEPSCEDLYSSFIQYLPNSKWYHKLFGVFPLLFDKFIKKDITSDKEYLMLDFI